MTGPAERYTGLADNHGPLVRLNQLDNNLVNGIWVRGEELTTKAVWDDTDIVHVLNDEILIGNHHAYSGLTLQSSNSESLVVKATGTGAITATGTPVEIEDRIGGTLHVLGTIGHPVVLTSLSDDSVGAGYTPDGKVGFNTNNSTNASSGSAGQWRGLLLDEFSNDRNVEIVRELENPLTFGTDINFTPGISQQLGTLAPNQKSGDENSRLGFEIQGFISPTDPNDVDVYSFTGTAGTEVWIDIDQTDTNLESVIEVINAAGTVVARSVRSQSDHSGNLNADTLTSNELLGGDHYTQNFRDAGLRYTLPGVAGVEGTYFIRVRSLANSGGVASLEGSSQGKYHLQVRLQQVQEFPGSTVRFSDIRFAQTGIDVRGLPSRSPIIGEASELNGNSFGGAQTLVNLLETDAAALGISGELAAETDVDWYRFDLTQTGVQVITDLNESAGTVAVVLDIDYADRADRADTTIAVYDEDGNLIFVSRESNVESDQPDAPDGSIDDLSRGSLGEKDPYIGPIHLTPGISPNDPTFFYVAVMSDRQVPTPLLGAFQANATGGLTRLEPVNSVRRVIEDHIGFQGYLSQGTTRVNPENTNGLFDITSPEEVGVDVEPFTLQDVALFVATDQPENNTNSGDDDFLYTVDPFESRRWLTRQPENLVDGVDDLQDVAIRTDGRMFGYQRLNDNDAVVGALVEIDPDTGATTQVGLDNINGITPTPNTSVFPNAVDQFFNRNTQADQFMNSEDVDALAFRRVAPATLGNTPNYDVFYATRESANASKLYKATEDGDASLRAVGGRGLYGVAGDIQPAGVVYETQTWTALQPVQNQPPNITNIRIKSKIPGAAGAFNIVVNRPNNTNANVTGVAGNTIFIDVGLTMNGAPSAQAIVDAINNDADARQLVTAVIFDGNQNQAGDGANGTAAVGFGATGLIPGADGPIGPLQGRVTGLSFSNFFGTGNLFGVTDAGEFLEIDPDTGEVVNLVDAANTIGSPGLAFEGLTLGPQNVEGGQFRNVLFALTETGQLVAFDTDGNGVPAFAGGAGAQVVTTLSDTTDGFFTLTTDAGPLGRNTTDPISVSAASTVSLNETQTIRTIGSGAGGTFTLSFVDDVAAVSSPTAFIPAAVTAFDVQDSTDFPATPFVIQVEDELMLVNVVTGDRFDVVRGYGGTAVAAHPDTATVFEVKSTSLLAPLAFPVQSATTADLDEVMTTLTVADASSMPATPFTVRLGNEEMVVTAVAGNDLTVTRAANGTTAEFHTSGGLVSVVSDTLIVADGIPLPTVAPFNIRVGGEDLRVTSVAGNNFGVIRGANGTSVQAHFAGSTVTEIQTTAPLAFDATNAEVEAALEALPAIGNGNVTVVNGPLNGMAIGTPIAVEFINDLAAKDIQDLTSDSSLLIGNEIQTLTIDPRVVGGSFTLEFGGETTAAIAWNASAADIQNALRALTTIGARGVSVSGTDLVSGMTIEFTGDLGDSDVALLTIGTEDLLQNEQQTVAITGAPTGGDFVLNLVDPANGIASGTSLPIAWNADATAVRNAIEGGIPELVGNVTVTETAALPNGVINIEFSGTFAGLDVQSFTATTNLTGGSAPTVVVDTVQTNDADAPEVVESVAGTTVSAPVTTVQDGVLSVRDALIDLPNFNPADIIAAGFLAPPGTGVAVTIGGQYAGATVNLMEVDNFLNEAASLADITQDPGGAGSAIMGVSSLNGSGANAIGLAFSPLDFNLWHPTTQRATEEGHGINEASDSSRSTGLPFEYFDGRQFQGGQGAGGSSYKFGLEPWSTDFTAGAEVYHRYGVNAQFGILTQEFHADLSSNPNIRGNQGTYNLPGGALGTLNTRTFDLSDSVPADRPTLYFNYFLETENHPGSRSDTDGNDPFRDSARVFISTDGGNSWIVVASNNSVLSVPPVFMQPFGELPGYLSHLSDAGLNSADPRPESSQIVQELFDNTGQWRQARVDLSQFAGLENLQLRVDFSTAGSMNDPTLVRIDGESTPTAPSDAATFGEFASRDQNGLRRTIRSNDNLFEGFYVDDFIIGYAERGEMVTGAPTDTTISDLFASARTNDPQLDAPDGPSFPNLLTGAYQLEVRRVDDFLSSVRGNRSDANVVSNVFDTNDDHTLDAVETSSIDFEPGSIDPGLDGWSVTSVNPRLGEFSIQSGVTFPPFVPFSTFTATPAELGGNDGEAGTIRFSFSTQAAADTGLRFFINGLPQRLSDNLNELPLGDPGLVTGIRDYRTVEFPFSSGDVVFDWSFDNSTGNGGTVFVDDIQLMQGGTGLAADRNRDRQQGMLMLHSNFITDSSVVGINVQPGTTESGGSNPHPGSTINFPQVQQADQRYVPGVVIANNVVAGSSGIRFAGETNADPQRPLPFGRIVNNTLVGTGAGTGIEVVGRASPTILNNLITEYGTGISDGGVGTVIRSNFFQDAGGGATGTNAIIAASGSPLFVNAAEGNYYLARGSRAIDSSQDVQQDRLEFVTFKTELGLAESPIVAPDRDVFGQLRIFSGDSPGGSNSQIQKDRGAVDRADTDAPYATLLNPIDNDTAGEDRDPTVTFVAVTNPLLENFTILLGDGRGPNAPFEGTGVDGLTVDDPTDPSVVAQAVVVEQNGVRLVQGVDYNVAYNELTGVLRLTPLASLWEASSVYVVSLDNTLIADRAGNLLRSNQEDGDTEFTIIIPEVGTDFGDAPDSYRTLLASDGARHTGAEDSLPKLGAIFDSETDGQPSLTATGDDVNGLDDEDGVTVGSFVGMSSTTEGLFLADGTPSTTTSPGDVIAFLNRNDAAGSVIPVTVRGEGVLDVWFDFNADGDFEDAGEYIVSGAAVVDGVNNIRVITPATAAVGLTFARFRLSEDGVSDPYGVAIGGEVEDFQVNILDVAQPSLVDDFYSVNEDNVLVVDGMNLSSLLSNDTLPAEEFIQPRVVVEGTPVTGMPNTFRTANGTVVIDDATLGLFTYTPDLDFEGTDTFRYAVSTQRNEGPEFDASAMFATVTIEVTPFNAPPVFDVPVEIDVFEDQPTTWTIPDYFMNVFGGDPIFGQDESNQTVTFTIQELSATPADLMTADPDVSMAPAIEFFPATDNFGTAVYEITGTDDGNPAESVSRTVTVNVRPINDAPRFDPSVTGTADSNGVDESWEISEVIDPISSLVVDGTITYTLREDLSNQTASGDPGYFIPFQQAAGSDYSPIGLLDVFNVGPANEADPMLPGGGQTVSMDNVPTATTLGGTLTVGMSGGQMGVFYQPPQDYNRLIGGPDTFEYSVVDDGESFINGMLTSDPQTSTNLVEFVLNPVNDRPDFELNLPPLNSSDPTGPRQPLEAVEDGGVTTIDSFAVEIAAGPLSTAFDEVDAINGQRVSFTLSLIGATDAEMQALFTTPPTISPEGLLTFEPAEDVFGEFEFAVIAMDTGAVDPFRGDVRTSETQTFTINVLPVNDPPRVDPGALPLNFTIPEDNTVQIFNFGDPTTPGLLDAFTVGPANEGEDRTPGGNQTVFLRQPTPTQTQFGGTVEQIIENNQIVGLLYTPRENFVGTDSFVYTVTDDGTTVDFGTGGVEFPDPRIAFNTVTIEVEPVNNPPQYSGPASVTIDEDAGFTSIPNWATNVLAGPPTATDELDNQDLFFTLTQLEGDASLFLSAPVAVIDETTGTASLKFETTADANGVAVFEVVLTDVPTDGTTAESTATRTFVLTVDPVNDIPTFTPSLNEITVLEDSGPYPPPNTDAWATDISPGPADESDQSVRFEVAVPVDAESLFQQLPTVDDSGVLRFLPATNANGTVDVTVTAIDSAGASAAPVTLRLIITAENDTPIAIADNFGNPGDRIENIDEDTALTMSIDDLLVNDIDPDIDNPGDVLSVVLPSSSFSLNGALVTYDEATGVITYDPRNAVSLQALSGTESVTDSFTYRAVDASGAQSNIVTVGLNVQGINDGPVAVPDNPTLNPNGPTVIPILDNDIDVDGDLVPSTIEITLQPAFGSLAIDAEGVVTYTAFQTFATTDVFRYRIQDDTGQFSNETLVTIETNAAPIARNDQAGTFFGEPIEIDVTANDEDPDRQVGAPNNGIDLESIVIATEPSGGDVVPLANGQIRYIPDPGFTGLDSFTYTVADLDGRESSPATVQVRVVSSRLQNPDLRFDVNDDGLVTPIDALLVINHLARSGEPSIPVTESDAGPPYYDVTGDQSISPLDALNVITELGRIVSGEGEGLGDAGSLVDPLQLDFLDSIASADDDDEEEVRLQALDLAFGDLL
ncbi:MAG: tandem-95 repeat protein [Planctomycetota bacterium]